LVDNNSQGNSTSDLSNERHDIVSDSDVPAVEQVNNLSDDFINFISNMTKYVFRCF